MNRTEIIKQLNELNIHSEAQKHCIKNTIAFIEELPDFQRIDEERFKRIYASKVCDIGLHIKEYNSTLPPALKPLPKEMPKDLTRFAMGHDVYEVWDKIISEYGTPEPKPSLPTVEELAKEMLNVWNVNTFNEVAEYVINKYSLHAREWWQDLKEGDKFVSKDRVLTFHKLKHFLFDDLEAPFNFNVDFCTPYTPPTADDIIKKHNLTEKEVKILREGK